MTANIGIIGFGFAGREMHYTTLSQHLQGLARVVAVCDQREIDPLDGVTGYTDLDAFLAHPGLDVVHVTVPSGMHGGMVVAAARAGKHVICDKPLETSLSVIDEVLGVCEENGVNLGVVYQQRFNPHFRKLKEVVEQGLLGKIQSAFVNLELFREPSYYHQSWHGTLALDGGGALMNQAVHYVDLLQWIIGSPLKTIERGSAERRYHKSIEAEDYGHGKITFENGAAAEISAGTCYENPKTDRFCINGAKGLVVIDDAVVKQAHWDGCSHVSMFPAERARNVVHDSPRVPITNHIAYFRAMYEALARGDPFPVPGSEGRKAVEIILGIYRASELGGRVRVPFDPSYHPSPAYVQTT
ncbi:Gfo/Idh/MocA family oxidoreductase [Candidatus Woesearchaeota archaeon]|nr:MAG: oxidoreductase protein [archaeon GW2011_AR4]MBS3129748.1 Gfo/Idh/MocA family oxidoreductase [Candidatus Woesearchaeota archaeon]HIH37440.1 Gfo/Idh/MocA family oxidoreductase [Candidatus Woesearchaeota archaeon]HIJ02871.1 Gfo/Idh/MocA family oxidoreductase [Candidatus Woesearchaeota archaeon]